MRFEHIEAIVEPGESVLVGWEHLVRVERPHLGQRLEVVTERVGELLRMERDVGSNPGQYVVTGKQHTVPVGMEADVPGGVSGCPHGPEVPAREVEHLVVFNEFVWES